MRSLTIPKISDDDDDNNMTDLPIDDRTICTTRC